MPHPGHPSSLKNQTLASGADQYDFRSQSTTLSCIQRAPITPRLPMLSSWSMYLKLGKLSYSHLSLSLVTSSSQACECHSHLILSYAPLHIARLWSPALGAETSPTAPHVQPFVRLATTREHLLRTANALRNILYFLRCKLSTHR